MSFCLGLVDRCREIEKKWVVTWAQLLCQKRLAYDATSAEVLKTTDDCDVLVAQWCEEHAWHEMIELYYSCAWEILCKYTFHSCKDSTKARAPKSFAIDFFDAMRRGKCGEEACAWPDSGQVGATTQHFVEQLSVISRAVCSELVKFYSAL